MTGPEIGCLILAAVLAWFVVGVLVSVLVGRAIALRDAHERPHIEARTVRPWVKP